MVTGGGPHKAFGCRQSKISRSHPPAFRTQKIPITARRVRVAITIPRARRVRAKSSKMGRCFKAGSVYGRVSTRGSSPLKMNSRGRSANSRAGPCNKLSKSTIAFAGLVSIFSFVLS